MTISVVSFILMVCSILTGLIVEAIKKMFVVSMPNILAAVVSVIVGSFISIGYIMYNSIAIDINAVLYIVSTIVLSWLSAMLGYDKVMQTLSQIGR